MLTSRRLRTPPGRQPIGKLQINWSHPLTRGLKLAVMPSQGYIDLVFGQQVLMAGSVHTAVDACGMADYQSSTAGNGGYFYGPATSAALNAMYDLSALTIFALVKNRSTAGNNGNGSFRRLNGSSSPNWSLGLWKGSNNGIVATFGTFSDTPAANNFDTTAKFYAIALAGDGANATSYVDGVVSKTAAYTPPTYSYGNVTGLTVNWGSPSAVAAATDANMALSLFWDHALTAAEIGQISRDPYCIFEYAVPQIIGVTVAGGAPSTAYYRRTLSQFGSRMGSRQVA